MHYEHKELLYSRLFIFSIITPLTVGLVLFLMTLANNEASDFCLASGCINNFLGMYKVPITIVGLAVPLSAIAAAVHRSSETAIQISISQSQAAEAIKQNQFNNYIKHKEDFFNFIDRLSVRYHCKFDHPNQLYSEMYPKNNYDTFSPYAGRENDQGVVSCPVLDKAYDDSKKLFVMLASNEYSDDDAYDYILAMTEAVRRLGLRTASEHPISLDDEKDTELVWENRIARSHYNNLRTIQRELSAFGLYRTTRIGINTIAKRNREDAASMIQRNNDFIEHFLDFKKPHHDLRAKSV